MDVVDGDDKTFGCDYNSNSNSVAFPDYPQSYRDEQDSLCLSQHYVGLVGCLVKMVAM